MRSLRGHRLYALPVCLAALLALAPLNSAGLAASPPPGWPQAAASDITADPAVRFGVLPNGLRYAVMHNETPKGQVSMRLQIRAGSMQETHDQEGLAHFIEHMAFRGTTHVADGQMIESLQRLGLQLGPDTNASTSQDATTYMFNLARSDAQSVETGLTLLREVASEVKFDPAIARTESGVVSSEERARAGQQLDAAKAQLDLIYGGHPYARLPIGRPEVIQAADVGRMRAFYDAYYRPERAILVVVGDIDPVAIEARIRNGFSDWIGKGAAGADPVPLAPGGRTSGFVALDGKPVISEIALSWIKPYELPADGPSQQLERLSESVMERAFTNRLSTLNEASGQPFVAASGGESTQPGISKTAGLAALLVNDWRASIELLAKARTQLLAYGFSQEELDRALTQTRANYKAAADGAATRQTATLADSLVASAISNQVFRTPADQLADFERMAPQLTLARVNAKAKATFDGAGPLVLVAAPGAPQKDIAALKTAYETAANSTPQRPAQAAVKIWPYTSFGPAGAVVERKEMADFGVTQVRYANGVRLIFKHNSNTKDQILVRVKFGHGLLDFPANRPGLTDGAGALLSVSMLSDFSPTELTQALAGKQASVLLSYGDSEFTANGTTRPADFATQLQLMAARFANPGWRPDLYAPRRDATANLAAAMTTSPSLVYAMNSDQLLHGGDTRWHTSSLAELSTVSAADARAFIEPILSAGPLEVLVAGDTDVETVIAEVGKTLGALPARRDLPEPAGARKVAFPAPTATPVMLTHTGRADQAMAAIAWPTTDFVTRPRDAAVADVLASIMQLRLTDQLRSQDGKTYSPSVVSNFSPVFDGYGVFQAQAEVGPADIDAFYAKAKAVAADLAATPVSADELARAVTPMIETRTRNRQANAYWMTWMNQLTAHPAIVEEIWRTMPGLLATITPAELQASARRWLVSSKAWEAKVVSDKPN